MGSKAQRQNQHVKRLERKIRQFQAKGQSTEKLEKELGYAKVVHVQSSKLVVRLIQE